MRVYAWRSDSDGTYQMKDSFLSMSCGRSRVLRRYDRSVCVNQFNNEQTKASRLSSDGLGSYLRPTHKSNTRGHRQDQRPDTAKGFTRRAASVAGPPSPLTISSKTRAGSWDRMASASRMKDAGTPAAAAVDSP